MLGTSGGLKEPGSHSTLRQVERFSVQAFRDQEPLNEKAEGCHAGAAWGSAWM